MSSILEKQKILVAPNEAAIRVNKCLFWAKCQVGLEIVTRDNLHSFETLSPSLQIASSDISWNMERIAKVESTRYQGDCDSKLPTNPT
jgi:hypothetical protein